MNHRMTAIAWALAAALVTPAFAHAQLPGSVQIPGTGQLQLPQKTELLAQARQMMEDLTSMKSSGSLPPDQVAKVDALLPKATALNAELEKPQVDATRLPQLATTLSSLQKDVSALKALTK